MCVVERSAATDSKFGRGVTVPSTSTTVDDESCRDPAAADAAAADAAAADAVAAAQPEALALYVPPIAGAPARCRARRLGGKWRRFELGRLNEDERRLQRSVAREANGPIASGKGVRSRR